MQISVLTLAATLAGFASAQTGVLPTCAQGCVTQFTSGQNIGTCSNIDVACICSSSTFLSGIACCLLSVCNTADQLTATQYAKNLCLTAGVTVPDSVAGLCPSGGSSTGGSGVASSTAASAGPATAVVTSATGSAASGAAATVSSLVSGASSRASSLTSAAAGGAQTATSAAAGTATSKAAGVQNMVGEGAKVVGGLAAVLALL